MGIGDAVPGKSEKRDKEDGGARSVRGLSLVAEGGTGPNWALQGFRARWHGRGL